jgi:prepilin-type N-terminal cleavage/methylation domain-containing protein
MKRHDLHAEDGFTLIELLTAMVISTVLLLAVLQVFDRFNSGVGQQTRITDANEQARSTVDRVVRDLRQAATIKRADANDLWYSVAEAGGATRSERICLAASGYTYGATTSGATNPGTACPSSGSGWTSAKLGQRRSLNSTADPLFRYDSTDITKVKAVGLTFNVDASGGGRNSSSTLRASAVVRRAAGLLAISDDDLDDKCLSSGAQLQLDLSGLPLLGAVSVTYASDGGVSLGSGLGPITVPAGITTVIATITDAAGVTRTISRDLNCT